MEYDNDFHDHSTITGRFQLYYRRMDWQYIARIAGLAILCLLIFVALSSPSPRTFPTVVPFQPIPIPTATIHSTNGTLTLEGNPILPTIIGSMESLMKSLDSVPVSILRIRNVIIDAPIFSSSLKSFSSFLHEIYLENVSISGEFNRVHLPNLSVFELKIKILPKEGNWMQPYQEATRVHSYLFFDPIEGQNWEMKDIVNISTSINILYQVNGTTLFQMDRKKDDLSIYLPYCDQILKNLTVPFKRLSLSTCSVSKGSIPKQLEYLNLLNVNISDGTIGEILGATKSLRYLFLDLPNSTLDIADLPKSLLSVSLVALNLTNQRQNSTTAFPDLTTLSFRSNRVSPEVYDNFGTIFPRVIQAAAIGRPVANYEFLKTCLKSRTASTIIEEFDRNGTTATGSQEIEEMLQSANIQPKDINFIIMLPTNGDQHVGFVLTQSTAQAFRYTLLGWYKFLTFTAYNLAEKYII